MTDCSESKIKKFKIYIGRSRDWCTYNFKSFLPFDWWEYNSESIASQPNALSLSAETGDPGAAFG